MMLAFSTVALSSCGEKYECFFATKKRNALKSPFGAKRFTFVRTVWTNSMSFMSDFHLVQP